MTIESRGKLIIQNEMDAITAVLAVMDAGYEIKEVLKKLKTIKAHVRNGNDIVTSVKEVNDEALSYQLVRLMSYDSLGE